MTIRVQYLLTNTPCDASNTINILIIITKKCILPSDRSTFLTQYCIDSAAILCKIQGIFWPFNRMKQDDCSYILCTRRAAAFMLERQRMNLKVWHNPRLWMRKPLKDQ